MSEFNWTAHLGQRLLLTNEMGNRRDEWTLLQISPSGRVGKFRDELVGEECQFWTDLDELVLMEVLP